MKTLYFNIHYKTNWGESLELCYSLDNNKTERLQLNTDDGIHWAVKLHTPDSARRIRYAYQVVTGQGSVKRIEYNSWRSFHFNHRSEIYFSDSWAEHTVPTFFQRSAFSKCLMRPRRSEQIFLQQISNPYLLVLHALPPTDNKVWAVVGNTPDWGEWNVARARTLQRTDTYEWCLPITKSDFSKGVIYKYILTDPHNPRCTVWEEGDNRSIPPTAIPQNSSFVRTDEMPQIDMPDWKGTGVVVPVFSLRSRRSFGIGDFGDLRLFIRWAESVGLKAVQLLPINDTTHSHTWRDSYPYSSISVFALHPIYLNPGEWRKTTAYKEFAPKAETLNRLPAVDYEAVLEVKTKFAQALYKEIGSTVVKTKDFKDFLTDNAHWLDDYARFCALRDHFRTSDFRQWPHKADSRDIAAPDMNDILLYHKFIQFLLHRQMIDVHAEAQALGIMLKGDIPIGISPNSVPAWTDSHLFHFNGQAGAPPDGFALNGQNWGFPTYNWTEMAKDGYLWWRRRLSHMKKYFDAYRIDHVLGFFRIWEIPSCHIHGVLGRFRPALPYSAEEIRNFGFTEEIGKFTLPFINTEHHLQLTEQFTADFTDAYLEPYHDGYTLKPPYRSQREIARLVANETYRNALLNLCTEVLFIADPDTPHSYHPRIAAQLTKAFATLSEHDRNAFNRLHDAFFYERHNQFWAEEAMKKLPTITQSQDKEHPEMRLYPLDDTGMLPCAEDLGMVPASVKGVLSRLDILSLEIQRMPKTYGVRFDNPDHNPYLSVASIGTHDMPPFRLWWRNNPEQAQAFWEDVLKRKGKAPAEADAETCEAVLAYHIHCPSMFCIPALQDLFAISPKLRHPHPEEEQINDPANPHQYWRYRMHVTIEELIDDTAFSEKLRSLIAREGNRGICQ